MMTNKKDDSPKKIGLTPSEIELLKKHVENSGLIKKDIDVLLSLISFNVWIQERLGRAKLTIKRLRQIFGFKSEAKKKSTSSKEADNKNKAASDDTADIALNTDDADIRGDKNKAMLTPPVWDSDANHGRYGHSDYTGCPDIKVPLEDETLKRGYCPDCAQCNTIATVTHQDPKVVVLLHSQPMVSGFRYYLERVRCNRCHQYFIAEPTKEMEERSKYDISCSTAIAIHHYYAGLPFKRIEMLQKAQGVPLPDATQFDQMDQLYHRSVMPVFLMLKRYAAQGKSLFFDDTPGKILDQMAANKRAEKRQDKQSIHTTALLSLYDGHRIYLFQTNTQTAGKELASLLTERASDQIFTTMSDSSSHNFPDLEGDLLAQWIITLCLCHARRKFVELLSDAHEDIQFVIDVIAQVYRHESHCKQEKLKDDARLVYHQRHSASLMDALKTWLNNLILFKQVEPNSRLGDAIAYLLKRWYWLTQFLRVPGAEMDNNLCEQAIKVAIRYRKNSLFYSTSHGADLGDAMMSVLHTCVHNQINIFHYLNSLQEHTELVNQSPGDWVPWRYQHTLDALITATPEAIQMS